eukprot:2512810-Rhodomonas_salina.1
MKSAWMWLARNGIQLYPMALTALSPCARAYQRAAACPSDAPNCCRQSESVSVMAAQPHAFAPLSGAKNNKGPLNKDQAAQAFITLMPEEE